MLVLLLWLHVDDWRAGGDVIVVVVSIDNVAKQNTHEVRCLPGVVDGVSVRSVDNVRHAIDTAALQLPCRPPPPPTAQHSLASLSNVSIAGSLLWLTVALASHYTKSPFSSDLTPAANRIHALFAAIDKASWDCESVRDLFTPIPGGELNTPLLTVVHLRVQVCRPQRLWRLWNPNNLASTPTKISV